MAGLHYFKFFTEESTRLDRILNDQQYGAFTRKLMQYAETFTKEVFPPDMVELQKLYEYFCEKINDSKQRYDEVVEERRKSGEAGGKAKAKNTKEKKAAQEPAPFSLSKQEIADLFSSFSDDLEIITCTKKEFNTFLNQLYKNNWYVGNKQLSDPNQLESIVSYKLDGNECPFTTQQMQWNIFCEFVSVFDESFSFENTYELFYMYFADEYFDKNLHVWTVDGNTYQEKEYKKVIGLLKDRLMANLAKLSNR